MKKIIFIVPRLYLGGAETQFRQIIKGFIKKGFNVEIIVFFKNKEDLLFFDELGIENPKYLGFGRTIFGKMKYLWPHFILNYLFGVILLIRYLVREKKSIIISYGTIMAPFMPIMKLLSSKVIFSERTATKKILKRKYLKFFYRYADIITCNSTLTQTYIKQLGFHSIYIPNGIDTLQSFKNGFIQNDIGNILIYCIARISPEKNQMIALQAIRKLNNFKIKFIGKKIDLTYYKKLLEFIEQNDLGNYVEFIDYTNKMERIYMNADIVLLPSFEEGMSNVILESFLFKRYCIASNIVPNKILLEGRGGLFDPNCSNSLIEQLKYYREIKGKESLNTILEANWCYVKEEFSLERMIQNYINLCS